MTSKDDRQENDKIYSKAQKNDIRSWIGSIGIEDHLNKANAVKNNTRR